MSADASISKPKTPLPQRRRSNSRSRISKTEQRPRSSSKSRKTTNTEPRKSKTTKTNPKDRSRSRNKVVDVTSKNVEKKEVRNLEKEKPIVEPTRMVLRKRALPKDQGIETTRPITPQQPVKEILKTSGGCRMSKLCHHVNSNKLSYLMAIVFLISLTLIIFNGYDIQRHINQFRIKIVRFLESQKKKVSH
uniref:Uncharacterized protein n=1 Tax=Strongyloides venezuelensis TaxID=75913 RepID=A0A0K0FHL5_STRVS